MASRRCEKCNIRFPAEKTTCALCGERLGYLGSDAPDEDWVDRVDRVRIASGGEEDKVTGWRCLKLIDAGYDVASASAIAARCRGADAIDLHEACELVQALVSQGRKPQLAAEILL